MSELKRLLDDPGADPTLATLLRGGSRPSSIDAGAYDRSRRRVLALGAAPAAFGIVFWIKNVALGAALGSAVAVAVALPRFTSSSLPAPSPTTPEASPASLAPKKIIVPQKAPAPQPAPSAEPAKAHAPASSGVASATPSPADLARETALLEAARAALETSPATALRRLAEHARAFPSGALAVEREFLTVAGLARLGRWPEARARAEALRARAPGSLYEERLGQILGDSGVAEPRPRGHEGDFSKDRRSDGH